MNVISIGMDLVDIAEIERSLNRAAFRRKVFTAAETTYCEAKRHPTISFAGKFAVKEAVMKALGAGIYQGVWFAQIEVLNRGTGEPYLTLYRHALERASELHIDRWHITITHTKTTAAAVVLAVQSSSLNEK